MDCTDAELIHPKKVENRKDVAARKKDTQAREDVNKAVEQPSDSSKSCIQGAAFREPNPLHPATDYFDLLSKDGKVPINMIFDPNSKGFDKLPLEVQVRSCKSFSKDLQETNDHLKNMFCGYLEQSGLGVTAQNELKCELALKLKEEFPNFKAKNIYRALELNADTLTYYKAHRQGVQKDAKYQPVIEIMRKLQQQSGNRLGKRTMTELLRRFNVNLSVPVVRRLMLENDI